MWRSNIYGYIDLFSLSKPSYLHTKSLELLFGNNGFGLEFQEVSMIPETSELDTAVLALQNDYQAAQAASTEL